MDTTEWKHLPALGGWLEQDEGLMADLAVVSRMAGYVRAQLKANQSEGEP